MGAAMGAVAAGLTTLAIWKKIDLTMVLNGALAGLVAVTAGSDIGVGVAIIEGLIAGILVVGSILFIDRKLKIDDPVGALSVHLVAGIWGTLAVGIFGSASFLTQLTGVAVIGAFVFIVSYVIWFILDKTVGIRVSEEVEYEGLDIHETGLEAYPEFSNVKGA
jgi:Amt family ammonium transporter